MSPGVFFQVCFIALLLHYHYDQLYIVGRVGFDLGPNQDSSEQIPPKHHTSCILVHGIN